MQCCGQVGAFPSDSGFVAAKVTIGSCFALNRAQEVEHLDDAFGAQVKVLVRCRLCFQIPVWPDLRLFACLRITAVPHRRVTCRCHVWQL
jgi:hypothetical protein